MNIKEAKQIRIVEYLRIIGYSPVNVKGHQYWYLSPFRDEKTASFKVNDAINEWYDFGISAGGDIIDLGKLLYRTDSISLVLLRISENALSVPVCRLQHRNARPCPIEDDMQNLRIECLSQLALLSYLRSRYIDEEIGKQYCKEAHYDLHKKHYFSIAFENRSGGYEVRNPYFKGCIRCKDITVIHHVADAIQGHVCIFEGFMDFLSYQTLHKKGDYHLCLDFPVDFLIMNSVGNLKKSLAELENYAIIHCYLDNDLAGRKTFETIVGLYNDRVSDESVRYRDYKDLNDYLLGKRR